MTLLIALMACAELVPPLMGLTTDSESVEGVPGDAEVVDRVLGLVLEVPSSMPTLIRASWSGSASGTVLYDDGETLRQARAQATDSGWEAWLYGATPGSQVQVVVEGEDGGAAFVSEAAEIGTMALGHTLVIPEGRDLAGAATQGDLVLVAFGGDTAHGVAVFNGAGQPVWAWEAPAGFQVSGASWCGIGPCVVAERGQERLDENVILQLDPLGEITREVPAPYAHHDVVMTDDGALNWLQAAPRETTEHGLVYGDRLVQTAIDGTERVLWDSWDTLPVTEGTQWSGRYYQGGRDWTHANGLEERDGHWLISLGGLASVVEIDSADGAIRWTLDGQASGLGDARFDMQHSPSWTPDGTLLLFVNRGPGGGSSWVAEFAVDGAEPREVWHTDREGAYQTDALGHTWRRPDGRTVVDYGKIPVIQQLDAAGDAQWELEFADGTWTTQVRPLDQFTLR